MRSRTLVCAALAGIWLAYFMAVIAPRISSIRGILSSAASFRQLHHSAEVMAQTSYRRIRLKTQEDLDRSCPVLLEYLKQPKLASSVQELVQDKPIPRFGCYLSPSDGKHVEVGPMSKHDQEEGLIVEAIQRLGLDGGNQQRIQDALLWKKRELSTVRLESQQYMSASDSRLNAEYSQSVSPLLLLLCPKIQILKVGAMEPPLEEFLLKANYNLLTQSHLQNLRHVKFIMNAGYLLFDDRFYTQFDILGHLRLIHRLPAIESVVVNGICEDPNGRTASPPGVSGLKKIHISHSDLSSMTLASIIRLPRALEEFSFSIGGRTTEDSGFALIFAKTLGKALLCQKSSLRVLDLDLDAYLFDMTGRDEREDVGDEHYPEWEEEELSWQRDEYWLMDEAVSKGPIFTKDLPDSRPYGSAIGSLRDFEVLTHLSIGVKLLLGVDGTAPYRLVDALPRSLECLLIRGYKAGKNSEHTSQIVELVEKMAERLPNLKEVLGIESEIPSAIKLEGGDGEYEHLLWKEEVEDDGWLDSINVIGHDG